MAYNGWVTNLTTGKDTKFHIHVGSMNTRPGIIPILMGQELVTATATVRIIRPIYPNRFSLADGRRMQNTRNVVAEFIAFNKVLGESDRLAVEGYLANKWGIAHQLPSDHANRDLMAGIGSGLTARYRK